MNWKQVSAERYDEMLGVLPPALYTAYGFLVGEPCDHRTCTVTGGIRATYTPLVFHHGKYYEGDPMTAPEFRKLDVEAVTCPRPSS